MLKPIHAQEMLRREEALGAACFTKEFGQFREKGADLAL